MYKLMLADDEGIVRQSLKFIVDKEFPGAFETFEAKTGRHVIELADEVRPDIRSWTSGCPASTASTP